MISKAESSIYTFNFLAIPRRSDCDHCVHIRHRLQHVVSPRGMFACCHFMLGNVWHAKKLSVNG